MNALKVHSKRTIQSLYLRPLDTLLQILLVHSLDKDTMLAWKNYVYFEGCSREASGKLKNARAKFANAKTAQKENAKNSMVSCLQYAPIIQPHQFTVFPRYATLSKLRPGKTMRGAEDKVRKYNVQFVSVWTVIDDGLQRWVY